MLIFGKMSFNYTRGVMSHNNNEAETQHVRKSSFSFFNVSYIYKITVARFGNGFFVVVASIRPLFLSSQI